MAEAPSMNELLGSDTPKNWGKWGPDDQVGSLNYLSTEEVQRGLRAARQGKVFTLQVLMANPAGDPVWPGRRGAEKYHDPRRGRLAEAAKARVPWRPALRR